jgi:hypothetical protein
MRAAAEKSNSVLRELGPEIQWVESHVTQDKIYCVYLARDAALIRKHAEMSGFPANRISEVKRTIDPTTAASNLTAATPAAFLQKQRPRTGKSGAFTLHGLYVRASYQQRRIVRTCPLKRSLTRRQ